MLPHSTKSVIVMRSQIRATTVRSWCARRGSANGASDGLVATYGLEQTPATRRRILESAGRRFERDGIGASGISALMSDAGLANGAFYAHFDSKGDLIATSVAEHLGGQRERLTALPSGDDGVELFVR